MKPFRRWTLAASSIEYKLPLLVCVLLLAVVGLSSWAAYRGVRDSTFAAARERLRNVNDQLALTLRSQANALGVAVAEAAANDTIRRFLGGPSNQIRQDVVSVLHRIGTSEAVSVELWSAKRERLFKTVIEQWYSGLDGSPESLQWPAQADTGLIGRMQLVGDSLMYPVSALVLGRHGPLGYLVEWRRASSTPKQQQATLQLIGSGAGLYIGNDRGDFWTDLISQVPKPPVDVRNARNILTYDRPETGHVFAAARSLGPLPWVVLVEFPERQIAAPVNRFRDRLAIVDALFITIGLGAAWWLGHRIAAPLRQLAVASTAIAGGDYSRSQRGALAKVMRRADELGQLGHAFDSMAAQIRAREDRLRDRVRHLRQEIEWAQKGSENGGIVLDGANLRSGERFAQRYEILTVLGRGGMGTVYRARDLELEEQVAIKTLLPEFVTDLHLLARFKDEIRLARRLTDRNIVRTHDFGEWTGVYFLTMEFVEGITVRKLIDTRGRLGIPSTLAVATPTGAVTRRRARDGRDSPGHKATEPATRPCGCPQGDGLWGGATCGAL